MKVYETVSLDVRQPAAWEWALRLANYSNENYTGTTVEVISPMSGNTGRRITWVSKHESLGAAEAYIEWYLTDEGFQKLIGEAQEQDLFDWSSFDRTFWRIRV